MAISHLLAPIPKWVLINNEGTVAGGARLYTYRSLNKIQPKIVYQDAGGTIPWTNPIIFDLNGVQGPFYWLVDSANLSDTYYLEAYDADNNLLWTLDDYSPPGAGGGGNVTTYIPLTNYIANNQFIDHIGDTVTTAITDLIIAPSNHKGFTPSIVPITSTNGVVGADIRFMKNSTANTDQITFPLFPLASYPLTGDVTPVDYIRYQCTTSNPGETYKVFQFPITQKVKNLSNQVMTFNVWAAVASTPINIKAYIRQYFGSGTAASAEVRNQIGSDLSLTSTWTQFTINFVVPDVAGKSIGTPGQQTNDDALYIQLEMPLNTACEIFFTKPALYLGNVNPNLDFQNYDQINSINLTPRTGDVKTNITASFLQGWVHMNDGSIGNVGSLATNRANADTFQLYKTLWDSVIDPFAPVSGGRGASAVADFLANKTLTLPLALGRALSSAGVGAGLTGRFLGQNAGAESTSIALTSANMAAHTHTYVETVAPGAIISNATGGLTVAARNTGTGNAIGGAALGNPGTPFSVVTVPPSIYMNFFIKL